MDQIALAPDFHDHRPGQWVHAHAHPEGQVLLATEGRMEVLFTSTGLSLASHSAIWIPPGVTHAARSIETTAFRGLMVHLLGRARLPARPTRFVATPLFAAAALELTAPREARRALASALLVEELESVLGGGPTPSAPPAPFAELCARVAEDPSTAPSLDRAAAQVRMSRRSFTRAFRVATGRSWGEWLREARVRRATALLAGGARVSDAALAVGYATPSAFSVAFRRSAGEPPRAVKRRGAGVHG